MGCLRLQDAYRIDPNDLRSLPAGVAWIVTGGRAAKVAVARHPHRRSRRPLVKKHVKAIGTPFLGPGMRGGCDIPRGPSERAGCSPGSSAAGGGPQAAPLVQATRSGRFVRGPENCGRPQGG